MIKIKEYPQRKFLTQIELSKLLGVGKTTVTRWENGQFDPTMKMKKKLLPFLLSPWVNIIMYFVSYYVYTIHKIALAVIFVFL
ncbi:helix-turn-helix transcriptional regulator [Acholeplasma sp. OttesenSCG-928-E16]|nr:helix-turn-helix transcriptional regulator [Acholeplasma sp. OttesenSCG-928-E16]